MKQKEDFNSLLSVAQLAEVRNNLPRGGRSLLAKKYGCSHSYITYVLKGANKNEKILEDAVRMALNHKKEKEARKKILQKQVQQLSK